MQNIVVTWKSWSVHNIETIVTDTVKVSYAIYLFDLNYTEGVDQKVKVKTSLRYLPYALN